MADSSNRSRIWTSLGAVRLAPNHLPSRFDGEVVAGVATGRVRCSDYEVAEPEMPTVASFFAVQAVGDGC